MLNQARLITRTIKNRLAVGDTIVEVLIAIGVAAFAIGTAYAIANRSIERAVEARERNEALNQVEKQITNLKFRAMTDPAFTANFAVPGSFIPTTFPDTWKHFCLSDTPTKPTDANWGPIQNNINTDADLNNLVVGNPGYANECRYVSSGGTEYFFDIAAQVTSFSQAAANRTVYKVSAHWTQFRGHIGESVIYYRVAGTFGFTGSGVPTPPTPPPPPPTPPPPPPPPPPGCDLSTIPDAPLGARGWIVSLGYGTPDPSRSDILVNPPLRAGCSYSLKITANDDTHCNFAPLPPCPPGSTSVTQPHEQVFIQLYSGYDGSKPVDQRCTGTLLYNSDGNISGMTQDIPDNATDSAPLILPVTISGADAVCVRVLHMSLSSNPVLAQQGKEPIGATNTANANSVHNITIIATPVP